MKGNGGVRGGQLLHGPDSALSWKIVVDGSFDGEQRL